MKMLPFGIVGGLILVLAACSSVGTVPSSSPQPTVASVTTAPTPTVPSAPLPTLAPTQPTSTLAPTIPSATGAGTTGGGTTVTNCGTLRTFGPQPADPASVTQATDCFWQAYQTCSPATLTVTVAGVDAGSTNEFELAKHSNTCQIQLQSSHYVVPRPTSEPVSSTCTGLVRQNGGLVFQGCGDLGDIAVPSS